MYEYRSKISSYLSQHRPDVWTQMSDQELDALADQITQAVIEEIELDPTAPPPTSNHAELVAHHNQMRQRAEEIVLNEMLYQAFPPPPEDDEVDETTAEMHQLLAQLNEARNHSLD